MPRLRLGAYTEGIVDSTPFFGFFSVDPKTQEILSKSYIPAELITNGKKGINPEDMRGIVLPVDESEGRSTEEIFLGFTAAETNGTPRAGLVRVKSPYRPEDFTSMEVLDYLPPMKNIMPIDAKTVVFRPDITEGNKRQIGFIKQKDAQSPWEEVKRITFPEVSWIGKNGRLGLVGWNERIKVPGSENNYRILVHGYSYEDEIYEYKMGVAEITMLQDGTFDIVSVDQKPLLTYSEAISLSHSAGKEPDQHKRVIYSVGGILDTTDGDGNWKVLLPLTLHDSETHVFSIDQNVLLRPFTK